MKTIKSSVFALCLVIFAASCGNGKGDAAKTDSAVSTPVASPAPAPMDTMTSTTTSTDTANRPGNDKMQTK